MKTNQLLIEFLPNTDSFVKQLQANSQTGYDFSIIHKLCMIEKSYPVCNIRVLLPFDIKLKNDTISDSQF